jgi:hypothetical protein
MNKICTLCKKEKPLEEFGRHRGRKDGRYSSCLECCRLIERKRKQDPVYNEKNKKYKLTESFINRRRERQREKYHKERYKIEARKTVERMVKTGELVRTPCVFCGAEKVVGHHPDYSKPTEVVWLCQKHHSMVHLKQPTALGG